MADQCSQKARAGLVATQSPFGLSSVSGDNTTREGKTSLSLVCLEIQPLHALYRFASQSLRRHCHLRQEGFCRWAPCHLSTEVRLLSSDTDDLPSRVLPYGDRHDLLSLQELAVQHVEFERVV